MRIEYGLNRRTSTWLLGPPGLWFRLRFFEHSLLPGNQVVSAAFLTREFSREPLINRWPYINRPQSHRSVG